jgi:DNA-3-methyladenine glycosylase II
MSARKKKPKTPSYWNDAKAHLMQACPVMRDLIPRYGNAALTRAHDCGFTTLLRAVVGQQISVKAADSVWAKFEAAVQPLTPHVLLHMPDDALRACGLSGQKVAYVRNVAAFFKTHPYSLHDWDAHSDAEVIALLTGIKGIGRWTAEMFLMFHLHRPDVLPLQDIGLLKAMHVHCLDIPMKINDKYHKPSIYERSAKLWIPYRSVATWYLWRALDPVPVVY